MTPLKSGDDGRGDWRHINRVASGAQFNAHEVQAAREAVEGRRSRHLLVPLGGGSGGNWNYRGLYTPTPAAPYMTFDVVQMGTGTASGMYLSTIDGNSNSPDTGIGWVQVSSACGTWL